MVKSDPASHAEVEGHAAAIVLHLLPSTNGKPVLDTDTTPGLLPDGLKIISGVVKRRVGGPQKTSRCDRPGV